MTAGGIATAASIALVLVAFAGLAVGARAETAPNALTLAELRTGWRLLFDGTSTAAFRGYRQDGVPSGWVVEDGALTRADAGGGRAAEAGDLISVDQFGSFELQLDYRVSPGGAGGVLFHVSETEPAAWMTGPEVQIRDNAAADASAELAGWLCGLYRPARLQPAGAGRRESALLDATRPAGEWNHVALRVTPEAGELCLNGTRYYGFQKGSADWRAKVAASGFAPLPAFGLAERGHLCLRDRGAGIAFRSIKIRELPPDGRVADGSDGVLPLRADPAFPDVRWEGWAPTTDDGQPAEPLRPLVVTHAGDGSGRLFVLDQSGMIHVLRPGDRSARLFLDLRPGTARWAEENEEGLLGMAFHPRFRDNGECFVCYVVRGTARTQRVSRFRVSPPDADRADPDSEEVVFSIDQPFANHNGGSIAFGPDGCLYIGLGDGGSQRDPHDHGQNPASLLGKILRIDVDRRDPGKAYAVPRDNPFVMVAGAAPETFALGFRNPWQIAFDRQTGALWAADVGQDLREEIDIVTAGGNYGWSRREGTLPFGSVAAVGPMIDPVWEYDHIVGRSITGGFVYRGRCLPPLAGRYLFGDHVSGRLWALALGAAGQVAVTAIPWSGLPVFGFGADEAGEPFVLTSSATGQGVFRLVPDAAAR